MNLFGKIENPFNKFGGYWQGIASGEQGLIGFLNLIIKTAILAAGIFAVFNIITAGYLFMTGGGDPKNISKAWMKITWTIVGLFFVAASVAMAALFGWLVFGDPTIILSPTIYGPGRLD
jgi:hypothetical protein